MSLYRHFAGKDELVGEVLQLRELHLEWLLPLESADSDGPLAMFDRIARAAQQPGFRGCPLLKVAAEVPLDHPAQEAVRQHKRHLADRIAARLTARAGSTSPSVSSGPAAASIWSRPP